MAILSVLSLGIALAIPKLGAADDTTSNWLTTQTLHVEQTADLPANAEPFSLGIDCTPTDFKTGYLNDGQQLHGCAYTTPLGTVANNYVLAGHKRNVAAEPAEQNRWQPTRKPSRRYAIRNVGHICSAGTRAAAK